MSNNKNLKALVAMSGGVDSSAAILLMQRRGCGVEGVTLRLCEEDPGPAAAALAATLGIPHTVLDRRAAFDEAVVAPFISTYEQGGTPNPCLNCNKALKFGLLGEYAAERGFDLLVTGHYARITQDESGYHLRKARCAAKDQSYVLYMLTEAQLAHLCFPLGELADKEEARALAAEAGLRSASQKDSQDICFIPDGDYAAFIRRKTGKTYPAGDFVTREGSVLGRHKGIIGYTIGQRKGLGLALPSPLYVCEKNVAENKVVLAPEPALYSVTVEAEDASYVRPLPPVLRCAARLRYNGREAPALFEKTSETAFRLTFDEPQRAVTPGQAAVLYRGDEVLGGGRITKGY